MKSKVWIIVVNYRTADLVIACLRSLSLQVDELGGGRVVVVDNASGDGSVQSLSVAIECEGWSTWARVMAQEYNGGFAVGNNSGIRAAMGFPGGAEYLLLLNPDTIPRPGMVQGLVAFMDAHPEVGIAGSLIENAEGGIENSAHIFHSPMSELDAGARLGLLTRLLQRYVVSPPHRYEAHSCDWVSGASMMLRGKMIEQIGLMDEGFFLYFEEVDYCLRARKAGWQCWYVPESKVMHLEGASTGIQVGSKRRAAYWYDSRRRFFVKHYGVAGLVAADVLWAVGRLSYLVRRALRMGSFGVDKYPKRFMFDLLWGDLRALFAGQVWRVSRPEQPL